MPLRSLNPWNEPDPSDRIGHRAATAVVGAISGPEPLERTVGLVFDMGDVLFDATAWRRWLLQQLARIGLNAQYRSFFAVWDREYLDDVHCGKCAYAEAFHGFLRGAGLTEGQIDEVVRASKVRKREIEADVRPFPGVGSTLRRLVADGVPMAVLSDSESPGEAIRRRLDALGLADCFAAVVSSVDLGMTKPRRECYLHAARLLQLPPDQLAFIGHDAEELLGARRAGMRTIAFNFDRDASADRYLRRFEDLAALPTPRGLWSRHRSEAA